MHLYVAHRQDHSKDRCGRLGVRKQSLPDPDALRIALEVRRSPLNHKEDKQTFDYAETLAEPIQRFADVLEKELTAAKEA